MSSYISIEDKSNNEIVSNVLTEYLSGSGKLIDKQTGWFLNN